MAHLFKKEPNEQLSGEIHKVADGVGGVSIHTCGRIADNTVFRNGVASHQENY